MADMKYIQNFEPNLNCADGIYRTLDVLKLEDEKYEKIQDTSISIDLNPCSSQRSIPKHHSSLEKDNFFTHRPPVTVKWKNLELIAKNGKVVLTGVSGIVNPGELTAIIGPSGAGKSTLFNILSGFTRQKVNGDILVNSMKCDRRIYRKLCCYIMQDDNLMPHMTVFETINMAANLKIPASVSSIEKQKAVNDCLVYFGLVDCQNVKASKLSGGQRKRLCIAQELVSNPPLIFLDEPTSGLDSLNCLQCVELLNSLAKEGRTIVCAIHQPSSRILEIFDKLHILAEGTCIYRGPTKELIPFLAAQGLECPQFHNPADFAIEVASGQHGEWIQKLKKATNSFSESEEIQDDEQKLHPEIDRSTSKLHLLQDQMKEKPAYLLGKSFRTNDKVYETSYWNQFKILTHRSFICTLREPMATKLRLMSHIGLGVLIGLLYLNIGNDASKITSNVGFLFFSVLFYIFAAMMSTILTFTSEKEVFIREHLNCWYSSKIYFLAKTVAEMPFQIAFPTIFGSIVYWMTSQPPELFRFSLFIYTSIMICLVSESLGLIIGASASLQNAVFMSPVVSIPMLMVSGFFIILDRDYLRWMSYTSYVRFSYQSMLLIIYSMDRDELECDKESCPFQNPMELVRSVNMADESLYLDFIAQWIFFFIFRFVAYIILWYKTVHNR